VLPGDEADAGDRSANGALPLMDGGFARGRGAGGRDRILDAAVDPPVGITRSAVTHHDLQNAGARVGRIGRASRSGRALHRHIRTEAGGEIERQRRLPTSGHLLDRETHEPDWIHVRRGGVSRR